MATAAASSQAALESSNQLVSADEHHKFRIGGQFIPRYRGAQLENLDHLIYTGEGSRETGFSWGSASTSGDGDGPRAVPGASSAPGT